MPARTTQTDLSFLEAVLANQLEATKQLLEEGADPNAPLDAKQATALFFACTPEMVSLLLEHGADATRRCNDNTSVIEAAAREGHFEVVQKLLEAAPSLATEESALLAADHPKTEALLRAVARGSSVALAVEAVKKTVAVLSVRENYAQWGQPGVPGKKGSQRYHFPARPGAINHPVNPRSFPSWMKNIPNGECFDGPCDGVLVFEQGAPPRWITKEKELTFPVPSVPFPYEFAFDTTGEHFFFAYGQSRVVGCAVGAEKPFLDLQFSPTFAGGNAYPIRIGVAGSWLGIAALEELRVLPFGKNADAVTVWFTCQLGTCVTPMLNDRAMLLGARSGGVLVGFSENRALKMASVESELFGTSLSKEQRQARMLLRVLGQGHNDPRRFEVSKVGEDTQISAFGVLGDQKTVRIKKLALDPEAIVARAPTNLEVVDAYVVGEQPYVRAAPIGTDHCIDYELHGVEGLWNDTFKPVEKIKPTGNGLTIVKSGTPKPFPNPHASVGTLSYPAVGPTGYALGFRVSSRPGFWNTYVVDREGVHAFSPHWFSGVTYKAFHPTEARAVLGAGREVIEVRLATRTWKQRIVPSSVRGVCYFEDQIAIALERELWIIAGLHGEKTQSFVASVRDAELCSFFDRRVLCVALAGNQNVFLARRANEWVVLGRLATDSTGHELSPEGDFLALPNGTLAMVGWEEALALAVPYDGKPLDQCAAPVLQIAK